MKLSSARKCELQIAALMITHYAILRWRDEPKMEVLLDDQALPSGPEEEQYFITVLRLNLGHRAPFLHPYDVRCTSMGVELKIANHN